MQFFEQKASEKMGDDDDNIYDDNESEKYNSDEELLELEEHTTSTRKSKCESSTSDGTSSKIGRYFVYKMATLW